MKLLHTADWHLGKRLLDFSRLEEQRQVMDEICQLADEHVVDAVLIAGDLYDTFNPSNEAIELFYKTLHRLADGGKRAVIGIAGNHDSPDRIDAPYPLAEACGIFLNGRPRASLKEFKTDGGVEITKAAPGFIELKFPKCEAPLRLLLTPYANESTLRQHLSEEENREEELRQLLQEHWKELADQYCDDNGVNMLMAHLYFMERGGVPPEEDDESERSILHMGGAQAIYTDNLPKQMQYVALGHLHRYQFISKTPCPVVYSSSPLAYSFSEAHQPKFVMILEAEPGKEVDVIPIRLQSGRTLARKTFSQPEEAVQWLQENPNTFVELTLETDSYLDASVKRQLLQAHDGIVSIRPKLRQTEKAEGEEYTQPIKEGLDRTEMFRQYVTHKTGQPANEGMMELFREITSLET